MNSVNDVGGRFHDATHLVVAQPALSSKVHLSMVIQTKRRFAMCSYMRLQALSDHIGYRRGGVE